MIILSVDTTAGSASVGISENGKIKSEFYIDSGNTHSQTLLPMIEEAMKVTGLEAGDIDLFALSAGPGSFTGVRIGAATVKGLAFAYNTPCVAVPTTEAMAYGLKFHKGIIAAAVNARRGTVYFALFRGDGEGYPERLIADCAVDAERAAEILGGYSEPVMLCGDGASLVEKHCGCGLIPCPDLLNYPTAHGVSAVAERIYNGEADKSVFTNGNLLPVYLKKPQAEREREERLAAEGNN